MRLRIQPWLAFVLIAVAVALAVFLVARRRDRFIRTDAEMVALLPHRDFVSGFVHVAVLREAGLLNLIQASKPEQDPAYQSFVRDTGLDYARDIEALAWTGNEAQLFLVVRGTFHWEQLRQYARQHGGTCNDAFCQVPTSRPGKWASFLRVRSNVAGVAVSRDPADVLLLTPRQIDNAPPIPAAPVWATLPHSILAQPKDLPLPVRMLALAVQSAERVTVSAEAGAAAGEAAQLRLEALFPNAAAANSARNQLEIDTNLLKMELGREHQRPSRSDLTGLLANGQFQQATNTVTGTWPVFGELLKQLQ